MFPAYIVKMYRTDQLRDLHFPYEAARKRLKLDHMDDYLVLPARALKHMNGTVLPGTVSNKIIFI